MALMLAMSHDSSKRRRLRNAERMAHAPQAFVPTWAVALLLMQLLFHSMQSAMDTRMQWEKTGPLKDALITSIIQDIRVFKNISEMSIVGLRSALSMEALMSHAIVNCIMTHVKYMGTSVLMIPTHLAFAKLTRRAAKTRLIILA